MFRTFLRQTRVMTVAKILSVLLLLIGLMSLTIRANASDSSLTVGSRIDIYTGAGGQAEPHVSFDSVNNRFFVAWLDGWPTSSDYKIYGRLVNADDSLYGTNILISSSGYIQRGVSNAITFDPTNKRFLVVWQDNRNGIWNIYGQLVNADGSLYGNNFAISPTPPNSHVAGIPTVQFDIINNRFLVVWIGPSYGLPTNIYGQFVNPDGSLHGSMIQITNYAAGYSAASPDIVFDPNNGRFLVTWEHQGDGYIYGRLVNANGTLYSSEITIGYYGYQSSYLSSLTFDPINSRFLIAYNKAGDRIWGQLINANGSLYGSEFRISDYSTNFPSVAFDTVNNKFFVVAYHGGSYSGVFGQFLNSDGSFYGSDFIILSGASSSPLDPFVAFGTEAVGFLVVWADTPYYESTGYDIFGKFVKVSGTGVITGTITDSTTGNGIAGATVSTDTGGYSTTTDSSGNYTLSSVTPGTYTVTASKSGYQSNSQGNVKVVAGQTTMVNLALTPTTTAPVANFTASPTSGTAPLAVQFTDQSTGNITSWSWSFGDGGTSTQQSPSHTYNSAGSYTVSLTVTGAGGSDTGTKASYIQVTKSTPGATVTISPATAEIKVGEELTLTATTQSGTDTS